MNDSINTAIVGATGLSGSVVAPDLIASVSPDSSNIINVVVQLIIGIATLIGLFRKKK